MKNYFNILMAGMMFMYQASASGKELSSNALALQETLVKAIKISKNYEDYVEYLHLNQADKKELLQLFKSQKIEKSRLPATTPTEDGISIEKDGYKAEVSFQSIDQGILLVNGNKIDLNKKVSANQLSVRLQDIIKDSKKTTGLYSLVIPEAQALIWVPVLVIAGVVAGGVYLGYKLTCAGANIAGKKGPLGKENCRDSKADTLNNVAKTGLKRFSCDKEGRITSYGYSRPENSEELVTYVFGYSDKGTTVTVSLNGAPQCRIIAEGKKITQLFEVKDSEHGCKNSGNWIGGEIATGKKLGDVDDYLFLNTANQCCKEDACATAVYNETNKNTNNRALEADPNASTGGAGSN